MKRMNFPERKRQRQKEAYKRQCERDNRSHVQQIKRLLNTSGKSNREMNRLVAELAE